MNQNRIALLPRHRVFLVGATWSDEMNERFVRVFNEVWRRITLSAKRLLLNSWRNDPRYVTLEGHVRLPWIPMLDCIPATFWDEHPNPRSPDAIAQRIRYLEAMSDHLLAAWIVFEVFDRQLDDDLVRLMDLTTVRVPRTTQVGLKVDASLDFRKKFDRDLLFDWQMEQLKVEMAPHDHSPAFSPRSSSGAQVNPHLSWTILQ